MDHYRNLSSHLSPAVSVHRLKQLGSALSEASSLAELRVSYNELSSLPQELARNVRLKIVEVGNNPISAFTEIQVSCGLMAYSPHDDLPEAHRMAGHRLIQAMHDS